MKKYIHKEIIVTIIGTISTNNARISSFVGLKNKKTLLLAITCNGLCIAKRKNDVVDKKANIFNLFFSTYPPIQGKTLITQINIYISFAIST